MAIDLNTASIAELKLLPSIGIVTAQEIVRSRPFTRLEQLLKVKHIGPTKYAVLTGACPRVCIGRAASTNGKKENVKVDFASESRATPRPEIPTPLVDLNSASLRELQQLHGVGPVIAGKIAHARPFHFKEELLSVKGIGSVVYSKLHHHVVVGVNLNRVETSHDLQGHEDADCGDYDSDVEPLELPASPASRSALHISPEIDSRACATLLSDLPPATEPEIRSGMQDGAVLIASRNIRNLSRRKDLSSQRRIAEIINA